MRFKLLPQISLIFILIVCNLSAFAQSESEIVDTLVDGTSIPQDDDDAIVDTAIKYIQYTAGDSISAYKKSKDFAYLAWLDSLLKVTKGIKSDTATAYKSSKVNRGKQNQQDTIIKNDSPSILSTPLIKIILWVIAGLFILFILYKLFFSNAVFKKEITLKNNRDTDEQEHTELLSDYDRKINEAMRLGNYRLVVRYLYLQTLSKLTEGGQIQYAAEKTNYQYVREVYNKPYRNEFASLTLSYEYVWYGNFEINEDICKRLQGEFNQFNRKI